jgi:hypothetical protein
MREQYRLLLFLAIFIGSGSFYYNTLQLTKYNENKDHCSAEYEKTTNKYDKIATKVRYKSKRRFSSEKQVCKN